MCKLRDAAISRIRKLRVLSRSIGTPLGAEERRALAFVTIELDNLIVGGLRAYTKISLLGGRDAAGHRITAAVAPTSGEEAAALILQVLNPRAFANRNSPRAVREKDEVAFRDPKDAQKVLLSYSASNIQNLVRGLSLNALVFDEAKICRHFFAHRAANTFEAVHKLASSVGVRNFDCVETFLVQGRPATGVQFMEGWLSETEDFFDLAA